MNRQLYGADDLPEAIMPLCQLIAQAPFAVWIADRTGKVVLFNEATRKLTGTEDPKKLLDSYSIFDDPIAAAQGLVPHIKRVLEGQVVQTVVILDTAREGFFCGNGCKVYYVRCLYYPITDETGVHQYIVAVIENITPQYLEDLECARVTRRIDIANNEAVTLEKEMVLAKNRVTSLKKKLASLKKAL
jgi:PAS domain-containing protein